MCNGAERPLTEEQKKRKYLEKIFTKSETETVLFLDKYLEDRGLTFSVYDHIIEQASISASREADKLLPMDGTEESVYKNIELYNKKSEEKIDAILKEYGISDSAHTLITTFSFRYLNPIPLNK